MTKYDSICLALWLIWALAMLSDNHQRRQEVQSSEDPRRAKVSVHWILIITSIYSSLTVSVHCVKSALCSVFPLFSSATRWSMHVHFQDSFHVSQVGLQLAINVFSRINWTPDPSASTFAVLDWQVYSTTSTRPMILNVHHVAIKPESEDSSVGLK